MAIDKLYEILTYMRPHASEAEEYFISHHLDSVDGMQSDDFGNRFLVLGNNPKTMFSCHTDTVHRDDGLQNLSIDANKNHVLLGKNKKPYCLGADDGAGIYLLLHMIENNINGLYVFHRGEEIGGLGSQYFSVNSQHLLENIKHCVAFDRKGYDSVITHQFGRCCSDQFAETLASMLNIQNNAFSFSGDPTGSFTDSANYTHLISECTNVSVGYFNQHTAREYQDTDFLLLLCEAVVKVDWDNLPAIRDPKDCDDFGFDDYFGNRYGSLHRRSGRFNSHSEYYEPIDRTKHRPQSGASNSADLFQQHDSFTNTLDRDSLPIVSSDVSEDKPINEYKFYSEGFSSWFECLEFIESNPDAAADLLIEYHNNFIEGKIIFDETYYSLDEEE